MAAKLSPGTKVLALCIQEAALTSSDVRNRLSSAVRDNFKDGSGWGYYQDHAGDADSGDVYYSQDGEMRKASYGMTGGPGAQKAVVDFDKSIGVMPRVEYDEVPDEDSHYAQMSESFLKEQLYGEVPLYERFISKKERDSAKGEDFAGSGKSFPILKPEDVSAAAKAIGRAGSGNKGPTAIKASIIRIAKAKGWERYLPKAWQTDDTKEESAPVETGDLKLFEAAALLETITLSEHKADYPIKIMSPGRGTSAVYPKEVIKRDGPKVFKAGTHMYLNHPTAAEEAARPVGDVKNLAGILTEDAVYHENHPQGEGLYSRMKVMADHAQMVEERAPHVGLSIRAGGIAEPGKLDGGLPILKEFTHAHSVDIVAKAGRDGKILQESADPAITGEETMTKEEFQKLLKEHGPELKALFAESAPKVDEKIIALEARALRGDATVEANRVMANMTGFAEAAKQRVIDNVLRGSLPLKEGLLDVEKFGELVTAEAKREAAYITSIAGNGSRVTGMGLAPVADPKEAAALAEAHIANRKREGEEAVSTFMRMGMSEAEAKSAANFRDVA